MFSWAERNTDNNEDGIHCIHNGENKTDLGVAKTKQKYKINNFIMLP